MTVFWDVTLDSVVEICLLFGGTWCLHLQGGYFENFYRITRRYVSGLQDAAASCKPDT